MNPVAKTLHLAPGATVHTRCIAEHSCPYLKRELVNQETGEVTILPTATWSEKHFSLLEIAQAGGGQFASNGRTIAQAYTVSPIRKGHFTVGTKGSGRTTTWSEAGFKLTKQQAALWRQAVEATEEDEDLSDSDPT